VLEIIIQNIFYKRKDSSVSNPTNLNLSIIKHSIKGFRQLVSYGYNSLSRFFVPVLLRKVVVLKPVFMFYNIENHKINDSFQMSAISLKNSKISPSYLLAPTYKANQSIGISKVRNILSDRLYGPGKLSLLALDLKIRRLCTLIGGVL
jgi:hypothetical protein